MRIVQLTNDNREIQRTYHLPEPWFGMAPQALLNGFADMPEYEIHVVTCTRKHVAAPEKLAPNIWFHSLKVPSWGMLKAGYLPSILAVRKKLREIQPHIVHGQGTERDCSISAVFSGFPNVTTIHGNMVELARLFQAKPGSFYWLQGKLETFTLGRTSGVLCNSEYTESLVSPRAQKCWRVPNAIRPEFFAPLSARQCTGKPIILNVGVISPRKQQVELLEAARQLHDNGLKFELQFIGSSNQKDAYNLQFHKLIAPAEEAGFAKYCGILGTEEMIEKFDSAHGLVHFPYEEAFGLVVAEAMARGLKFFGADLGGIHDIADGVPGADLIEPGNFTLLLDIIAQWLHEGAALAPEAASVMADRYHPNVIARRHIEIYQELLGERVSS